MCFCRRARRAPHVRLSLSCLAEYHGGDDHGAGGGARVGRDRLRDGDAKTATDWSDPNAFHDLPVTLRPAAQFYRVEAQVSVATVEGYVAGVMLYP